MKDLTIQVLLNKQSDSTKDNRRTGGEKQATRNQAHKQDNNCTIFSKESSKRPASVDLFLYSHHDSHETYDKAAANFLYYIIFNNT